MYESRTRILLIPLMGQYRYLQNTNPKYFIAYKFPRIARHKISQDTCMVKISLRYALGVIKSYTKIVRKMMHFSKEKLYSIYLSPVFSSSLPVWYFSFSIFSLANAFSFFCFPFLVLAFPFSFSRSPLFLVISFPCFSFPFILSPLLFSYPSFQSFVFPYFVFPHLSLSFSSFFHFRLLSVSAEAKFLDEIQTKVLRLFLLVINGHFYSFALTYVYISSNSNNLLQFLYKRKAINLKENHTPFPMV
jgi:hypothetical protein